MFVIRAKIKKSRGGEKFSGDTGVDIFRGALGVVDKNSRSRDLPHTNLPFIRS
jgi:hypothetical protein